MLTERPLVIHLDAQNRLHHVGGLSIAYPDGWGVPAIHGIRMPIEIVNDPSSITAAMVQGESNAERRRILIELMTVERYIRESGAKPIHHDSYGTLYRINRPGDTAMLVVEVENSTPEPDGSIKHYFLRVQPTAYGGVKTARAAVASTWRHPDGSLVFATPSDYVLTHQS